MKLVALHTSDRLAFKRCRRKWDLGSSLRRGLTPVDTTERLALWLGSGLHFALEDYHGYRRFPSPVEALEAYYQAFRPEELPDDADNDKGMPLLINMLEYYPQWLAAPGRYQYETLIINGVPQVEVPFELELTDLSTPTLTVVYRGTLDRVVVDSEGGYWVQDYKTTRIIDLNRMINDPQMKAYTWAAEQMYNVPFEGALLTQLVKAYPHPPAQLTRGGYSVDKRQKTTHALVRSTLIEHFGSIPNQYVDYLNHLALLEQPEGNSFIRTDRIMHNTATKVQTYQHILAEASEMLNLSLPIYPNETRDCPWDCSDFRAVCLAMEDGGDWLTLINENYKLKGEDRQEWRKRIKWPHQ